MVCYSCVWRFNNIYFIISAIHSGQQDKAFWAINKMDNHTYATIDNKT